MVWKIGNILTLSNLLELQFCASFNCIITVKKCHRKKRRSMSIMYSQPLSRLFWSVLSMMCDCWSNNVLYSQVAINTDLSVFTCLWTHGSCVYCRSLLASNIYLLKLCIIVNVVKILILLQQGLVQYESEFIDQITIMLLVNFKSQLITNQSASRDTIICYIHSRTDDL